MRTGKDAKEGDEVLVVLSGNAWRGSSIEERTYKAVIEKASRVWLDVRMVKPRGRIWRMRRDTQSEGSKNFPDGDAHFYFPEQYEEKIRQIEADKFLRSQGIDVRWESPWRGREVELADLIRAHIDDNLDPEMNNSEDAFGSEELS